MKENDNAIISIIFATVVLILLGISYMLFTSNNTVDISVADVGEAEEIIFSNITDSSITISWYTEIPSVGGIKYGNDQANLVTTESEIESSNIHYIRVTGLNKGTNYYFQILGNEIPIGSVLSKSTFNSTQVSTPETLRVSLPVGISSGIVYVHASNGTNTSTVSSVRANSQNITVPINNLKDPIGGNEYYNEEMKLMISVTAVDGNRYRTEFNDIDGILSVDSSSSVASAYNPSLVLGNVIATNPDPVVTPEPDPIIPIVPSNPVVPTTPVTPTVPVNPSLPTAGGQIPDTAIDSELLAGLGSVLGGIMLIGLGMSLRRKPNSIIN